jgi:thymidylate synthase (FAD)
MKVTYLDHMGSDLTVANAARVSFGKRSTELSDKDIRLINFLARQDPKHFMPFCHPQIQLHIKAPIFVARQLAKHQVGFAWNEVSRRYVDSEPELYWPEEFRLRASNKKQGSSDEAANSLYLMIAKSAIDNDAGDCEGMGGIKQVYEMLIESGIAPEQARMILPLNTYTEWYWTGSLYGWTRVYNLRTESSAQLETRYIAASIGDIVAPLFPYSWEALTNGNSVRSED